MNRFHTIICNIFVLALVINMSSAGADTYTEDFSKELPFPTNGELIVDNVNGKISIEGWDKDILLIEATKQVNVRDEESAREVFKEIKIEIKVTDNGVEIETRRPKKGSDWWDWIFGDNVSYSVSYKIYAPYNARVKASSTNGAIYVQSISGKIELKTTNGRIEATAVEGEIRAHTTNGSIEAEIVSLNEVDEIALSTTNGSITLYLPEDASFKVRAKTTNGSITCEFPVTIKGEVKKKRLEGVVKEGKIDINLKTTNGSIKIKRV